MKNTLSDLNNHLFDMLEKLNDDDLVGEELDQELNRAKGVSNIAKDIVSNANLMLDAAKLQTEYSRCSENIPNILKVKEIETKEK